MPTSVADLFMNEFELSTPMTTAAMEAKRMTEREIVSLVWLRRRRSRRVDEKEIDRCGQRDNSGIAKGNEVRRLPLCNSCVCANPSRLVYIYLYTSREKARRIHIKRTLARVSLVGCDSELDL